MTPDESTTKRGVTKPLELRPCDDVPTLKALHRECFPRDSHPAYSVGDWWVALDDGKPVAFAGLQPSLRWGDAGYLARAGVLPTHRGQGIQRRLIRVRERKARAYGWKWCITSTFHNPVSANNLIRCGYLMYEPAAPWGAIGTLYWKRDIAQGNQ